MYNKRCLTTPSIFISNLRGWVGVCVCVCVHEPPIDTHETTHSSMH